MYDFYFEKSVIKSVLSMFYICNPRILEFMNFLPYSLVISSFDFTFSKIKKLDCFEVNF